MQPSFNLVYIDCKHLFDQIYLSTHKFDRAKLSKRDLQKLIIHFLIVKILNANKGSKLKERPVYYFFKSDILGCNDEVYINEFLKSVSKVSKLCPLLITVLEDSNIFIKNNGGLTELNHICSNFYTQNKNSTKKLLSYLKREDFFELKEVFQCINNLMNIAN